MKEIIIDSSSAQLAKEKGFKLAINTYYLFTNKNKLELRGRGYIENWNEFQNRVSAPTQSLLQKWLLENHNIFVTVSIPYEEFGEYAAEVWGRNEEDGIKILLVDGMTVFDTYSKALEEGLEEGLKLIK